MLPVLWFVASHVLTVKTPIGRKVRPHVLASGAPADPGEDRTTSRRPASSGCRGPSGVQDGLPVLEDGRVLDVANVIWCTGFRQDFSWIDVPVFDDDGAAAA